MATKPAAEPTTATPAEPATVVPAEPVTTEPISEPTPEPAHDATWWEGRAKAMEAEKVAAIKKLAKLETAEQARKEAELTELEKAQKRADEAEKKAKAAELSILRRDVAAKVGLPAALVDRLKGDTEEEIEADAKILLASLPVPVAPKLNTTNPGQPQTGETDDDKRERLLGIRPRRK